MIVILNTSTNSYFQNIWAVDIKMKFGHYGFCLLSFWFCSVVLVNQQSSYPSENHFEYTPDIPLIPTGFTQAFHIKTECHFILHFGSCSWTSSSLQITWDVECPNPSNTITDCTRQRKCYNTPYGITYHKTNKAHKSHNSDGYVPHYAIFSDIKWISYK